MPAPQPFTRQASLSPANTEVHVAGVTHYIDAVRAAQGKSAPFILAPEPTNPFDPNAVAVYVDGSQIGHVPAELAVLYGKVVTQFRDKGVQLHWTGEAGEWDRGVYARFDSPTEKQLLKIVNGGDAAVEAAKPVAAVMPKPDLRRINAKFRVQVMFFGLAVLGIVAFTWFVLSLSR